MQPGRGASSGKVRNPPPFTYIHGATAASRVGELASCYTAGLKRPSRFVCARRIIVSVNHSGFDDDDDSGTLIGRLDPPLIERMNVVQARLQADAAIRVAAQEERQEQQAR